MESKEENRRTTKISKDNASNDGGVGQGELYSPFYAKPKESKGEGMGMVEEIRRHVGVIKEKMLDKLAAASVPADALETARNFLESVVKDVTVAAHGLTRDTLHRIKTHVVDILPSLSSAVTSKMVDDAAEEAKGEESEGEENPSRTVSKSAYLSPTSSLFASLKPFSRL